MNPLEGAGRGGGPLDDRGRCACGARAITDLPRAVRSSPEGLREVGLERTPPLDSREQPRTPAAPGELAALDQIASRVLSAEQEDKPFGIAVAQLLKAFWLLDAQILEHYYRGNLLGWGTILSHCRGDVIHHGYLHILEATTGGSWPP